MQRLIEARLMVLPNHSLALCTPLLHYALVVPLTIKYGGVWKPRGMGFCSAGHRSFLYLKGDGFFKTVRLLTLFLRIMPASVSFLWDAKGRRVDFVLTRILMCGKACDPQETRSNRSCEQ
jgi:hypothetical protein